jgi:hypothetical protein
VVRLAGKPAVSSSTVQEMGSKIVIVLYPGERAAQSSASPDGSTTA